MLNKPEELLELEPLKSALALAQARKELAEYKRELESLIPGGSEFVGDPKRCAAVVLETRRSLMKQLVKSKQQLTAERERAERAEAKCAEIAYALNELKAVFCAVGNGIPGFVSLYRREFNLIDAALSDNPGQLFLDRLKRLEGALRKIADHDGDRWDWKDDVPERKLSQNEIAQQALAEDGHD